jgi:hypothetical protein
MKFRVFYEKAEIKYYCTASMWSVRWSPEIGRARIFSSYKEVTKFVTTQPEVLAVKLNCEEIE